MNGKVRIIGIDPGLVHTGWGVVDSANGRLSLVAAGVINPEKGDLSLANRLLDLHTKLRAVLTEFSPDEAAVEQTFVNVNPTSTLKLGQARGVVLLCPAESGIPVAEYTPNQIKKAVVGVGHATKDQVDMMVHTLLPGVGKVKADASDALAMAICHSYMRVSRARMDLLAELAKK